MSVLNYVAVRDAVVAYLAGAFPAGVHVAAHPGRFDEAEIKQQYTKAPALLTSIMNIGRPTSDDNQRLELITWVLVRATNQDKLFDQGLILVSKLVPTLLEIDTEWSMGGGDSINARNLYSSSSGQINVALWAVTWNWNLRGPVVSAGEGGILLPDSLENFEGYNAIFDVGTQEVADTANL